MLSKEKNAMPSMVIHGDTGAIFEDGDKYPVSASFSTNSFLHTSGGIFYLTKLVTKLDTEGAWKCRIKPIDNNVVANRDVVIVLDIPLTIALVSLPIHENDLGLCRRFTTIT